MRDSSNRKRKEPDNNFLNITNNKLLSSIISTASNVVSSIIKVEINIDASKTPPPQEQNPLNGIPRSFKHKLIPSSSLPNNTHQDPQDVARFIAPKTSSLQPPAQMRRTSSSPLLGPSSSPPPAQMRRTSSSPLLGPSSSPPPAQMPRTPSSQSNDGPYSSQQPNKKQKTNHKSNIYDSSLIEQQDRTRQDSLGSENIRKLAESFFKQPQINVPTNPTIKEIYRQEAKELNKEEERIKGLQKRHEGASRNILVQVYPKPTRQSEIDAEERRIKEEILRRRAKKGGLKGHDSINNFINRNWSSVSQELVNYVGLYGFDGAIESDMKNCSRYMTHERVPSNRGGGRRGGGGRY
jgi:hypothetical protein